MNAAAERKARPLLRALVSLSLLILLPGLLAVAGVWWLGTSEGGSRWLGEQATRWVPQLELEITAGSLASGLSVSQVAWREQDWAVSATELELAWRPACLLATRVCLTSLQIDRIEVTTSGAPTEGPLVLPVFSSPVAIVIAVLEVDQLVVSDQGQQALMFESVSARSLRLREDKLSGKQLQFTVQGNQLQARGELQFSRDHPLSLDVEASLAALQQPVEARLSGSVRELRFEISELEGLPLNITGEVAPLAAGFPLQATVTARQPFAWSLGDNVIQVLGLRADISGDNQGLNLELSGKVSESTVGEVPLSVVARWSDGHIWLDRGELQLQEYPLQISGEVLWSEEQAPYLQDLIIRHEHTTLSLQGNLAERGLLWSLQTPVLSDYLPELAGHASAEGKLVSAGTGYTLTLRGQADELGTGDIVGAALALECTVQVVDFEQPLPLRCAKLSASLPATDWFPASAWRLQKAPVTLAQWQQGNLNVAPFCLQEQSEPNLKLCLTDTFSFSVERRSELRWALTALPLYWLDRVIPGKTSLLGDADIRLQVAASDAPKQALSWQARIAEFGDFQGNVELAQEGKLLVRGEGVDLAPLLQLAPELGQLSGTLDLAIEASQTPQGPWVTGLVSISDARVGVIGQTGLFASSLLQLELQGQQAQLQGEVAAEGGPAQLSGFLDWRSEDWAAQIRLQAQSLAIAPLPGVTLQLVPDLTLSASPQGTHLSGDILIPGGVIDLSHISGSPQVVSVSADTQIVGEEPGVAMGPPFSAAVTVRLGDEVRFQGYGLIGRLFGSALLEKQPGGPLLAHGSINVVDGRWRAYGQDLIVEEGRLEFGGPLDEPYLRLRAERQQSAGDTIVGVLVDGPLADPRIRLFSSEAMSEQERMHYLITGQRLDAAGTSGDSAGAQVAVALGLAGTNQALGRRAEELGIQGFALGTEMGERGQEAQVSGYFGPNLYLKYGYSMFEPGTTFSARYRLTERFYIEGYQSTSSALNLLWYIRRRQNNEITVPDEELPE